MEIEDFTTLMKALSDSNRVRGLLALNSGELCVCQLIELLKLAPSTVSKHMSILKQAKLVQSRKEGRWIYYRIANDASVTVQNLIELTVAGVSDSTDILNDKKRRETIKEYDLYELCKKQRGERCCS